ncbi:MAG TPA: MFS transporter [Patescibacteria group bacterium]|nr:MFS transporter [Patescibacteria group bacterium]
MRNNNRWWALFILCFGVLMIVLDTTIVNIALPSIKTDLGFSESSLVWVLNAYLLTFGGFLLLSGRLGDLFGQRKLFMIGIVIFTLASLACGIANSQALLVVARAVQGLGGAVVTAVALSLIINLFPEPAERAKAMGVYSFVAAAGGSVGLLLGGLLTNAYDWHWNFLVNIPVGIVVVVLSWKFVPATRSLVEHRHLDIWGAITVTTALLLAVYAIVGGNQVGWGSVQTLVLLGSALALLGLFVWIETKVRVPLVPLSLFKLRNVLTANTMAVFWAAAMFAWFFLSALYLQLVLQYNPLQVGLAFLPGNVIMAMFSLGLSAKIVTRFGILKPLGVGLSLAAIALLYLSRAPIDGTYVIDVLPSMVLLGLGAGMAFNPMLLAAMNDVPLDESGLSSGLVNTSFMMGGALGLAVLASLATAKTSALLAIGTEPVVALNSGYHTAFMVGAAFAAGAAALGFLFIRVKNFNAGHTPHSH